MKTPVKQELIIKQVVNGMKPPVSQKDWDLQNYYHELLSKTYQGEFLARLKKAEKAKNDSQFQKFIDRCIGEYRFFKLSKMRWYEVILLLKIQSPIRFKTSKELDTEAWDRELKAKG